MAGKIPKNINTTYDIVEAFRAIEDELIASMIRNLDHHRAEELKEGFNWSQWQVEQLAALDEYKKRNLKKYQGIFGNINSKIDTIISMQRAAGNAGQEISILKAIKEGVKLSKAKKQISATGMFFKANDNKINALIKATKNDFERGEIAILRRANDQYRKIIFNAQVYASAGASYEQAVDMATKDFLSAGINCIEYANGARHTMADYADMALRTAQKRAYLTGEGEKRKEWGISTVIMNKRTNPCPKCLPFVGKVLIDDVWSGGSKDGISETTGLKYPLMSDAIEKGLYHPRCKDSHTTYFEGISTPPDDKFSREELEQLADDYNEEQKQQYAQRQAEKYERLSKYSLDKDNQKKYAARAAEWGKQSENYQMYRPVERGESETIEVKPNHRINIRRVESYPGEIYISDNASIKPKALHTINRNTEKALKKWGIPLERKPKIIIVDISELNAYGKYDAISNVVFYIPEITDKEILVDVGITEYHEIWHMKQAEKFRKKGWKITKKNYGDYLTKLSNECKKTIDGLGITEYNVDKVSDYAASMFDLHRYDEVEAEYMSIVKRKEM